MKVYSLVLGFAALLTATVASPITAVNENAVETPSATNFNPANILAVAQPQASQCIGQWWTCEDSHDCCSCFCFEFFIFGKLCAGTERAVPDCTIQPEPTFTPTYAAVAYAAMASPTTTEPPSIAAAAAAAAVHVDDTADWHPPEYSRVVMTSSVTG